jgi:predicted NAD/FAD-binding protein
MDKTQKSLAVVGSGIAGLSAAWLLRKAHQVVLFEKNDYLGGHTHTLLAEEDGRSVPVDTGFIVYNEPNYPYLSHLFEHLGIQTQNTDMSFAVSVDEGRLEYAGDNLNTLFAQRRNLYRWDFFHMLKEILRFNGQAKRLLHTDGFSDISLGDFLDRHGYSEGFRNHYLLPMAAAIWSCPTTTMLGFPVASFARFFANHGLLNLVRRPQWKTVSGGSWNYVKKMSADLQRSLHTDAAVVGVRRHPHGVSLRLADGTCKDFDAVVMACHADEALALLENPTQQEQALLSRFSYQTNRAWLHTDRDLMPRSRKVWSAWNYLASNRHGDDPGSVSVTYWMNRLQRLEARQDYLVSLNPLQTPRDERVLAHMVYQHPVFDQAAMAAQQRLPSLQGQDRIWYSGSYFGYGFHEDALRSSVQVARSLGAIIPWEPEASLTHSPDHTTKVPGLAEALG